MVCTWVCLPPQRLFEILNSTLLRHNLLCCDAAASPRGEKRLGGSGLGHNVSVVRDHLIIIHFLPELIHRFYLPASFLSQLDGSHLFVHT